MRPPSTNPRARRAVPAVLAVGLALTLFGCGSSSSNSSALTGPDPATILPASTLAYGEVTVQPTGSLAAGISASLKRLFALADPGAKIESLIDKQLDDGGTYGESIKPWLGANAGFGLLASSSKKTAQYALIVDQTNSAKAAAALTSPALNNGKPAGAPGTYDGVTYHHLPDSRPSMVGAIVGKFLVVGTLPALEQVIAVDQGAASLAGTSGYKQAVSQTLSASAGFAYVPLGELLKWGIANVSSTAPTSKKLLVELAKQLGPSSVLVLSAHLQGAGATIDLGEDGVKNANSSADTADPATLAALPAGSWLAIAESGLSAEFTKSFNTGFKAGFTAAAQSTGASVATLNKELAQIQAATGLNIEGDFEDFNSVSAFAKGTTVKTLEAAVLIGTKKPAQAATIVGQFHAFASLIALSPTAGVVVGPLSAPGTTAGFTLAAKGLPEKIDFAVADGKIVIAYGAASLSDALSTTNRLGSTSAYTHSTSLLGSGSQPFAIVQLAPIGQLLDNAGALKSDKASQVSEVLRVLTRLGAISLGSGNIGGFEHLRIGIGGN
jgi:hypothetical protein